MLNNNNSIFIRFADEFENNVYSLSKRYRNIRKDIESFLEQIQLGNFIGDRIAGLGEDYWVIKARVKNSNIQKGKSAGYRVIYQVESPTRVLLLTIYRKKKIAKIVTKINQERRGSQAPKRLGYAFFIQRSLQN